nr:hypothetical protein [uncultured Desulfobacter sp.]
MVEVNLNGLLYCLKRNIVDSGQANMSIFEGRFDDALSKVDGWTQYPMRRSNLRHSFSQQIFELLGLPRHKTDDSKNLTLHQILRLIYVDQLSSTTKLLKEDKEYDNITFRRAIGDYLLGIDDLEAHNLRQDLLSANKDFEKINSELNAIYRLFGKDATKISEELLDAEIDIIESQLEELKTRKKAVLRSQPNDLNKLVSKKATTLQNEIDKLSSQKQKLEGDKAEITLELTDTELFVISLKDRREALEQSRLTFTSLDEISFKYCPACLEPISEEGHIGCPLCKTEKRDGDRDIAYIQMLNELNFQIKESEALIIDFKTQLDRIHSQLPGINLRLEEAKFEYQELEVTAEAKNAIIAEIASEMGFCKSQILSLEDRREHVTKVESMRQSKADFSAIIQTLQDKLDQVNARQEDRYNNVYDSIEKTAGELLSQDGSYEPTFDNVEEVTFDFAKDKMFVNGRSKFSASSMVVMKNSIRLAIFLHAVDDNFARLPNLLIMDNIEDKGMIEERSHNFQKIIVTECAKLKDDHQLIFTTSMINPGLDDTEMCVGPMYLKGSHTLLLG